MLEVGVGVGAGAAAVVGQLAVLEATVGLGVAGWGAGLGCGLLLGVGVAAGARSYGAAALGPADLVTLGRAALACGVAALVAQGLSQGLSHGGGLPLLVALAATALALDAVDGRVARSTGTTSAFGARFDGEADAFLILVLSIHVAASAGWWVLTIGLARYLFGLVRLVWPSMRAALPRRDWRKVVAAGQGIVLTVAAAEVLPDRLTTAALLGALALLGESFGRDLLWCWRHPLERKDLDGAERTRYDAALRRAREAAYPPGEFAGQESFMRAGEIRQLAARAGVGPGVRVLDLCCGVAGPGRLLTEELGCSYLGVDASPGAVRVARARATSLPCRFVVAEVPPVPAGEFDVVLLLETLLAFPDKDPLLRAVAAALPTGGRFAFTLEEGEPLTAAERSLMPGADTVWLVPLPELVGRLERAGLVVSWLEECTASHREVVDALVDELTADAAAIARRVGRRALDDLVTAHRLWSAWLGTGRVRKFAVVTERCGIAPLG